MGETTATLELVRLSSAGRALADELDEASAAATEVMGQPPAHRRLAAYARKRISRWA